MKLLFIYGTFLFWIFPFLSLASGDDYKGGIPLNSEPLKVQMGFTLSNITDVNEREETIDFDGALFLKWNDDRLAYDPTSVGYAIDYKLGDHSQMPRLIYQGDFSVKEIFEGWRPYILLQNGIGDRVQSNISLGVWPDGTVAYGETFSAKAETPMDLRRFPFDRQKLEIYFQVFLYNQDQLLLIPDENLAGTWDQNIGIAQWENEGFLFSERTIELKTLSGRKKAKSEFIATINIKRQPMHFLFSTILPLIVLVCLSWTVFWLDDETVSNRINISFIGILSVVAYYFVIQNNIPNISYLTLIDVFIITTFFFLAASVIVSLMVDKLNRAGKSQRGDNIDAFSRWIFPASYLIISVLIVVFFFIFT